MPHANPTTSSPRVRSPLASENTLPCSEVIISDSSSACFSTSSLNLNMMRARFKGVTLLQLSKASCALSIAARVSSDDDNDTDADCSPVAGLYTAAVREDVEAAALPPI